MILSKKYEKLFAQIAKDGLLPTEIYRIKESAQNHILWDKLVNEYGFKLRLDQVYNTSHITISDGIYITLIDGKDRTISWSDDDNQPKNEMMYVLRYPSGAYTFHSDYPVETFNAFFNELKSFGPKYSDTMNHALYFELDKAAAIHEQLPGITKKYRDQVKVELAQKQLKEAQALVERLNREAGNA